MVGCQAVAWTPELDGELQAAHDLLSASPYTPKGRHVLEVSYCLTIYYLTICLMGYVSLSRCLAVTVSLSNSLSLIVSLSHYLHSRFLTIGG